ncbi:tripartite tricarboxylate transporter substrate binding protein [Ferrovibrio sp.]|uniref:Bug family tripartite tricarboxylate transporter substrate binding protein n=1 Tax=Ferrovibrio sp. TaxID=1917215 RepID=UPI001B413789|nr:tripartite tricarboxylate transporter substrate binding protein [Ferrovibrio sp.]MBP7063542.1 tripartite tricarboxylate transporter substrate binding protein [Ferrovibrio sp.]
MRLHKLILALGLLGLAQATPAGITAALAQGAAGYPNKPIKFIVPFAAGSATDTVARVVGNKLGADLKQNVVVENAAGGSGVIAAQKVAQAAPDGYTLLISTNTTHAANQSMLKKLPYDAVKDFETVSMLGTIPMALVVHPSVPAGNVPELIAYAKANPGKLTFGSGSSSSRISVELLKAMTGIDILHVGYKSNPQAVTDLLGGQLSLMIADVSTTLPQAAAGKVKALGVSTAQPSVVAPGLPTIASQGVPGYQITAWFAAWLPAKTDPAIADLLQKAIAAAVADKEVQDKLLAAGIEPQSSSRQQLADFVVSETKKWAEVVKAAGIEPE